MAEEIMEPLAIFIKAEMTDELEAGLYNIHLYEEGPREL